MKSNKIEELYKKIYDKDNKLKESARQILIEELGISKEDSTEDKLSKKAAQILIKEMKNIVKEITKLEKSNE